MKTMNNNYNKQLALAIKSAYEQRAENEPNPELREKLLAQAKKFCWHEAPKNIKRWQELNKPAHDIWELDYEDIYHLPCVKCGTEYVVTARVTYDDIHVGGWKYKPLIKHPRFTIAPVEGYISITATLEDLGLWEEFKIWLSRQQHNIYVELQDDSPEKTYLRILDGDTYELLTTPELLATTVTSFLKGRE